MSETSTEYRVPSAELDEAERVEPLWWEALPMTPEQALLKHWRYYAEPWMTVTQARDALKHCLDCWEIGGRILWVFGIVLDRSRMPR